MTPSNFPPTRNNARASPSLNDHHNTHSYTLDSMLIDDALSPINRVQQQEKDMEEDWESIFHADIDAGDENDPQLCCVYVNDIYTYLRESEVCLCGTISLLY